LGDFHVTLKVLNERVPLELETNRKKAVQFPVSENNSKAQKRNYQFTAFQSGAGRL